ncbi:NUDIX hydrolase [Gordonia westfalica]|uniref:8-oxo-dGTP pyrophosphatase MutT, NUDIX family n=1 Tax=Gordonia westfalica TaxID=158898 RepID=A0A1H2KIE0_9ACTN|nr:CoA pyrophosphatase [Gordonia westfalica]SDU68352.1 8-oxo-dGTP pyrophosphatase MutT, NUDIX family [Gordonia westfalica]
MSDEQHVGPLVHPDEIPPWLHALTGDVAAVTESVNNRGGDRTRWAQMFHRDRRPAAVLVLFSGSWEPADDHPGGVPADAEVLLTERASTLRQHSGQVAFPGGAADPGDDFPVGTALREAREETGLDASGVHIVANLASFPVPPSGFDVVPVIGYWREPSAVRVVDPGETARVDRINLRELLAPENRFQVRRSVMGGRLYQGPAFFVDGLLVWGFTGGLLAAISDASGWDRPWDLNDVRPLDEMIERAGNRQESGFSAVHPRGLTDPGAG